jgi:hypothetical protein
VDPFFLPLPVVYPNSQEGIRTTIYQLEQYLDVAQCLLRKLAERLQNVVGPDALEPELNRFLAENDVLAHGLVIAQFDSLIKGERQTEAVRLFRERFGVTWDQAHDLYACWTAWDQLKKMRCLQAAELRQLFAALMDRAGPKDNQPAYAGRSPSSASTPSP